MGIEPRQHAIDGIFDKLGVVWLLDILGPDPFEYVAEKIQLLVDFRIRSGRFVIPHGLKDE
jgi:hypothetical protein